MRARAAAVGLNHTLVAIPGAGHVPQQQLLNASAPFLRTALRFMAEAMDLRNAECPQPGLGHEFATGKS